MKPIDLFHLSVDGEAGAEILEAVRRVLERGWFVLGPEVEGFEAELAVSGGVRAAVGVGCGTDALVLGLRALGIGPGDEVIVPAFTAFATAAAVLLVGATPLLVDVQPDRPIPALDHVVAAVTKRTRAVILVHLYGIVEDAPAWVDRLGPLGIHVIEDCAQAHGGQLPGGRPVGSAGVFGAFSFYPTKNLGGLGDGGALLTDDLALAAEVRSWRSQGERGVRHRHHLPAGNSRLDDLQAAALRIRLERLPDEIGRRRELSAAYEASLAGRVAYAAHGAGGAPHLAVIRVTQPDALAAHLAGVGIGSGRHYPWPLDAQPALGGLPAVMAPHAASWARSCLSVPLHPSMQADDIDRVVDAVTAWLDQRPREK